MNKNQQFIKINEHFKNQEKKQIRTYVPSYNYKLVQTFQILYKLAKVLYICEAGGSEVMFIYINYSI